MYGNPPDSAELFTHPKCPVDLGNGLDPDSLKFLEGPHRLPQLRGRSI